MQSTPKFAGAFPTSYQQIPALPWSGVGYSGAEAAGPQPGQLQTSGASSMQPVTPLAGQVEGGFNQLWQAGMPQPDNTVGNVVIKVEEAAPKQQKAKQKPQQQQQQQQQHKGAGKPKKGSGRRDLDKLAKQEQRMIKNRESAARSRLRRQEHTTELEQENETLRAQVATLQGQVQQLQGQVADMEWQLQLCRVPGNMQRASINVSHPQQTTGGISQLPPAPSLSISLPHASSLMLPPMVGPLFTSVQQGEAGVMQQEGLGLEGFDFAFSSRRGSSFA